MDTEVDMWVRGVVSYGVLTDNRVDRIAPVGELSNLARTYSRDQQVYSRGSGEETVHLTVFRVCDGLGTLGELRVGVADQVLAIGQWLYGYGVEGELRESVEGVREALLAAFGASVMELAVGPLVEDAERGLWLPQRIDCVIVTEQSGEVVRTGVRLWLSDQAFIEQYDEMDLELIGPVDHLDDLFRAPSVVRELVGRRSTQELMELIRYRVQGQPYTLVRSEEFDYYPPGDPELRFPTTWTFVIWGSGRDHYDRIRQRLADWILSQSAYSAEQWAALFPDIFSTTEFIITPLWTRYAIANRTDDPGMYSPTVPLQVGLEAVQRTATGPKYTPQTVHDHTAVLNTTYKSLALLVTGGPENRNRLTHFFRAYRDYLAIPTASPDFDRMRPRTRLFVEFLHSLLFSAESVTEYSVLPDSMTRVWRTNAQGERVMYVTARHDHIQYLVVSKQSMVELMPPDILDPLQLTGNGVVGQTRLPHMVGSTYETVIMALGGQAPYHYEIVEATTGDWWPLTHLALDSVTGQLTAVRSSGPAADLILPITVTDHDGRRVTVNFELHTAEF